MYIYIYLSTINSIVIEIITVITCHNSNFTRFYGRYNISIITVVYL